MIRQKLEALMTALLQEALDFQREDSSEGFVASKTLPLIGDTAVLTSLGFVSFIADVEMALLESHDCELTLVSENALSRRNSPFRSIDSLVDYVLELTAVEPAQPLMASSLEQAGEVGAELRAETLVS